MGQVKVLNINQERVLKLAGSSLYLGDNYYFTGGTALAEFYLKHRISVDLDFFSLKQVENQKILQVVNDWKQKLDFTFQIQEHDPVYTCLLNFADGSNLKVDFSHYPYQLLQPGQLKVGQITVDSLFDIAVNKLLTLTQRHEVKDFVDSYFLLQQFSIWDLREGLRVKFGIDFEPFNLAANLLSVEDFEFLPQMLKPLKLVELKSFFKQSATTLSKDILI